MNTCLGTCSFPLSVSSECFSLFLVSCQGTSSKDCRKPAIVQAISAMDLPVFLLLLLPKWLQLTAWEMHFWPAWWWYLHFEVTFHFVPFREHCECHRRPCDKICWTGKNCQRVSPTTVPSSEPQARYFSGVRSGMKLQMCPDRGFRSFCLSVLTRIFNCDQKASSKNFIWWGVSGLQQGAGPGISPVPLVPRTSLPIFLGEIFISLKIIEP